MHVLIFSLFLITQYFFSVKGFLVSQSRLLKNIKVRRNEFEIWPCVLETSHFTELSPEKLLPLLLVNRGTCVQESLTDVLCVTNIASVKDKWFRTPG